MLTTTAGQYNSHRKAAALCQDPAWSLAARLHVPVAGKSFAVAAGCHRNLEPEAKCTPGYPSLCSDATNTHESWRLLQVYSETYRNAAKGKSLVFEIWCVGVTLECEWHLGWRRQWRRLSLLKRNGNLDICAVCGVLLLAGPVTMFQPGCTKVWARSYDRQCVTTICAVEGDGTALPPFLIWHTEKVMWKECLLYIIFQELIQTEP